MSSTKQKSPSVSKIHDIRTARTLARIDSAFVALIQKRAYASIRVSDIARKAKVGRATFYAHYASKHELLRSQVQRVVAPMLSESPGNPWLFDCTRLFSHIRHSRLIYRSLLGGLTRSGSERIVQDVLEERTAARLARMKSSCNPEATLIASVAARFVATSLLAMLGWWIENDTGPSPETMQGLYQSLVGPGLKAVGAIEL